MADDELNDIVPTKRFTPEPNAGDANNNIENAPPLMINGQYVKDLSFEAPNAPDIFTLMQSEVPTIQVDVNVEAEPKGESLFEVALTVRAEAKLKDELAYLCEIEYAGLFSVNIPEEHLGPVLLIECPLIVFPFLRRIIADITGDGGFAPLMLAPIDFAALYQQRMAVAQEAKQSESNSE